MAVHSPLFSSPLIVAPVLVEMLVSGELVHHASTSLVTISYGFALASAIGFVLGILATQCKPVRLALMPVVDSVRPIAALTLFPLLILLLGLGIGSKVFVIFWTAWPAVLLNTMHGLDTVDVSVQEAAQLDGASRWQLLRYILLPLSLPAIVTGLRIGLSGGWISLVSAEMLGASAGLGYSILAYSQTFRFPAMYAVIVTIAFLGLLMNISLSWLQNYVDHERIDRHNESPFLQYNHRSAAWASYSRLYAFRRSSPSRS